jgi:hypothetical protein
VIGRQAFAFFIDVANRDNLAAVVVLVTIGLECAADVIAASAHANYSDIDAVVRAEHATALNGSASAGC